MVAYWATLAINISDLTRFAKNQKVQYIGQTLGMPTTMTLYSFIGVAVTSASVVIFGSAIWDPVALMIKTGSVFFIYVGLIFVILATLTTNIAANMVAPINDVMHVYPKKLNWEVTTIIISLIGILMQPWRFLADPNAYIWTWLLGYGAFLGPVAGVVIADFWLIRKQTIKLDDIYKNNGYYDFKKTANPIMTVLLLICAGLIMFFSTQGLILGTGWPSWITTAVLILGVLGSIYLGYSKTHGVNMVGAVSLFLGIVVSMGLPLLVPSAGMWTWFIGLFISLVLYYVLYPAWYAKDFSPVPK